jgi:hypothetical protein
MRASKKNLITSIIGIVHHIIGSDAVGGICKKHLISEIRCPIEKAWIGKEGSLNSI